VLVALSHHLSVVELLQAQAWLTGVFVPIEGLCECGMA
jgi:hypothetical protein